MALVAASAAKATVSFAQQRTVTGVEKATLARSPAAASVTAAEAPGYNDPPEDAWEWLSTMENRYQDGVSAAIDAVKKSGAKIVSISYYRSQEEYDALGRDEGPVGFANAISRELMVMLEGEEIEVRLQFPEEADTALTSAIMMTRD